MIGAFLAFAALMAAMTWAAHRWPHACGSLSWHDTKRDRAAATDPASTSTPRWKE